MTSKDDTEPRIPETVKSNNEPIIQHDELEYLLKELELHINAETSDRDRLEQIAQFSLASLTAIGGGALLIWQITGGETFIGVLVLTFAAIALTVFGFYILARYIRYSSGIVKRKIISNLIRNYLSGILVVPSGLQKHLTIYDRNFYKAYPSLIYAAPLSIVCGLSFSVAIAGGITIWLDSIGATIFKMPSNYFIWYGLMMLIGFVAVVFIILSIVAKARRSNARMAQLAIRADENNTGKQFVVNSISIDRDVADNITESVHPHES